MADATCLSPLLDALSDFDSRQEIFKRMGDLPPELAKAILSLVLVETEQPTIMDDGAEFVELLFKRLLLYPKQLHELAIEAWFETNIVQITHVASLLPFFRLNMTKRIHPCLLQRTVYLELNIKITIKIPKAWDSDADNCEADITSLIKCENELSPIVANHPSLQTPVFTIDCLQKPKDSYTKPIAFPPGRGTWYRLE